MNSVNKLLGGKIRLPSPPAIALRILDAVRNDDRSFTDLAGVIKSDQALAARILKFANSPFYRLSSSVSSIERALALLGTNVVKNIALSFVVGRTVDQITCSDFDAGHYWKRSITAAVAADLIARRTGQTSDELCVTALLQDIGVVVMFGCCPDDYHRVLEAKAGGSSVLDAERAVFGFDHQEVGADLLRHWRLPESIHVPIRYHHTQNCVPAEHRRCVDLLGIADMLSSLYHGNLHTVSISEVRNRLETAFGIRGTAVDTLIDGVAEESIGLLTAFDIDPGDMKPFSQMMQEANEELSNLNISYELLVTELKQARDKAEELARELGSANDRLRELAFRDGLTGLYNHRYFQEALERELERAGRYGRDLSLMLLDIDHFKKVNDTYGHMRGDLVLRELGRVIAGFVRTSDVAARYGGEEFAVILPETDAAGAKVLAERLRESIERLAVTVGDGRLGITVSVGITGWHAGTRHTGKDWLIEVADKALYQSKLNGRNRVTVIDLSGC